MFQLKLILSVTASLLLTLSLYCPAAVAYEVVEATPIEQGDTKTLDDISGDATSEVFGATPAEQDDTNTLDDISGGATSEAFEATPAEQDDIHTIDQLND